MCVPLGRFFYLHILDIKTSINKKEEMIKKDKRSYLIENFDIAPYREELDQFNLTEQENTSLPTALR